MPHNQNVATENATIN